MAGKPPMHGAPANSRPDTIGGIGSSNGQNPKDLLPTFIYDYFLKEKEFNLAQALLNSKLHVATNKSSPKDVNGVDDDQKDENQKRLDALPRPALVHQLPESPFLRDWWALFWDLRSAWLGKSENNVAINYFQQSIANSKQAHQARQSMLNMPGAAINAVGGRVGPGNLRAGPMDMRQTAMANSTKPGMRAPMNVPQQAVPGQMQREGSDMDLNGQRPPSPMSAGDNEPSPKRPRTDGGPQMAGRQGMVMGGPMPNGVPVSSAAAAAMISAGFDPAMMANGQFQGNPAAAAAAKHMQMYGLGKAGMPQQPSPMMGANGEMQPADMAAFQQRAAAAAGMQGNGQQGGALADYQMQLMLLEQQNKKRLLMARQEQDHMNHGGAPQGPGAPGANMLPGGPPMMTAPGMSPHGSRTGHSPNNDGMKRATPKMGQSSPMPDGSMQNRASPVPGFDGAMPHQMAGNAMFMASKMGADGQMGPAAAMMRHPNGMPGQFIGPNGMALSQQQMEMIARQQQGRMPGGMAWPGGPQMQGAQMMQAGPQMAQPPPGADGSGPQQQQQQQQQQRNPMPPPSAPAGANNSNSAANGGNNGNSNNGAANAAAAAANASNGNGGNARGRASSPPQGAAPSTPSQTAKAAPKKKDTKDTKKKGAQKKGPTTTGATPNSSAADHTSPTPSTPTIPVHPNSFAGPKGQGGPSNAQNATSANAQPQPQAPQPPQSQQQQQPQQPQQQQVAGVAGGPDAAGAGSAAFNSMEQPGDMNMPMEFANPDSTDVLDGFDFDSFLHMDNDMPFAEFDTHLGFSGDGVEMQTAEP